MAGDIIQFGNIINRAELNVAGTLQRIMLGGHALQVSTIYEAHKYKRMAAVLQEYSASFQNPILGYGKGLVAEQAIVRALYTFTMAQGPDGQHPEKYVEGDHGRIEPPIKGRSQLDHTLDNDGELWVHHDGKFVVASSYHGAGVNGTDPLQVFSADTLDSLDKFVDSYNFDSMDADGIEDLPKNLLR
jgi:hypothetical protein